MVECHADRMKYNREILTCIFHTNNLSHTYLSLKAPETPGRDLRNNRFGLILSAGKLSSPEPV